MPGCCSPESPGAAGDSSDDPSGPLRCRGHDGIRSRSRFFPIRATAARRRPVWLARDLSGSIDADGQHDRIRRARRRRPPVGWAGGFGDGTDGRRRPGPHGRLSSSAGPTSSASTSARASTIRPPQHIASWRHARLPGLAVGGGGRGLPRCRPRHGQRSGPGAGTDGAAGASVGAVGGTRPARRPRAPAICCRRSRTTHAWCPATCRRVIPNSTSSPARSASAVGRCSACGAESTPHSVGTTAISGLARRWPARLGGFAGTAASICR